MQLTATVAALVPIAVVAVLLLANRSTSFAAWSGCAVAVVVATVMLSVDGLELARSVARGAWTGAWILLIVLPALLLYAIMAEAGAVDRLAGAIEAHAATPTAALLLMAWVLPSFLQGIAGFGVPIALCAPLLRRRGMPALEAVALCMIGYQWSVTFGSMGSSYFMAEATARLTPLESTTFGRWTAVVLGIGAVTSGLIVYLRTRAYDDARRPRDAAGVLVVGAGMALALTATVRVQPALGSTAAGLAGLLVWWLWFRTPRQQLRPERDAIVAAAPYVLLTCLAASVVAAAPLRTLADRVPAIAPELGTVSAAFGYHSPAGPVSPPFRLLHHPLIYLCVAIVCAAVLYHRAGWLSTKQLSNAVRSWRTQPLRVGLPIVGLTVLAAVAIDSGMVALVAQAIAGGLGGVAAALSPLLGMFGTLITGSTTASNALLSGLQVQVAAVAGLAPVALLVGQTAGGGVGNAIAPAVATVGLSSVASPGSTAAPTVGAVLRRNLGAVIVLVVINIACVIALNLR
ncbi:MAG: L-lactate permease [Nitriliruptoraceae bacterium]